MTVVQLKISPLQDVRIKKAIQRQKGVCIWATPTSEPDGPQVGPWILSDRQLHKLKHSESHPTKLQFSADQLKQNLKHEGGFLPLLASALIPLVSGVVGGVIEKEISGGSIPSIYVSRPTGTVCVKPHREGLYLGPYAGRRPRGHGLFQGEKNIRHTEIKHPDWEASHKTLLKTLL